MTLNGRDETSEGIDKKLAVHYYARWRFIHDLLPSLERAKEAGEEAKTMSVLAAGKGGEIDMEDLGLKTGFSLSKAGLTSPTYNDLMLEVFISLFPSMINYVTHQHTRPSRTHPSIPSFLSFTPTPGSCAPL